MEKKTCSTFRLVFALCRNNNHEHAYIVLGNHISSRWFHSVRTDVRRTQQKLKKKVKTQPTVSKNLMPYSSARACPFEVGTACIQTIKAT